MKVLINRTDAIGDTLLSTPLARLIKEKKPEAKVAFLVSPRSGDLISLCEGVDQIFTFEKDLPFYKRFGQLKEIFKTFKPDTYFHLGGSFQPTFLAWLLRIPFRGGLRSKMFSFLFLNKGLRQSRSIVSMHESEYNMGLGASLNYHFVKDHKEYYAPKLNIDSQKAKEISLEILGDSFKRTNKTLIIVHPGMSGHTLNWSSRNYGRLIDRLEGKNPNGFHFVVSYTPTDEPYLIGLREFLSERPTLQEKVLFFNGAEKGLIHYAHFLSTADLFIGPSTGTTHMANAMDVPQVALFSPIKVQSSLRWGPFLRTPNVRVLVPDVVCGEVKQCAGAQCPYYECMSKIEVEEVTATCMELLEERSALKS